MAENKRSFDNMEAVLRGICRTYPKINPNDIEFFTRVYYPVATIDAGLVEESFEDFNIVERAVLEFVAVGFSDISQIAEHMGLTSRYVSQITELLRDYGHINSSFEITPLGIRSLNEGKKIRTINTRQLFEVDAVNGYPLRLDSSVFSDDYISNRALAYHDVVIEGGESVDDNFLRTVFNDSAHAEMEGRMREIININVRNIIEPKFVKLQYAVSYLLKLKGVNPIIFSKMMVSSNNRAARAVWQPFAVDSVNTAGLLDINKPILNSEKANDIISQTYHWVFERAGNEENITKLKISVDEFIDNKLELNRDGCDISESNRYILGSEAFTVYNKDVLRLLVGLGTEYNVYLHCDPACAGGVVKFCRGNDMRLKDICFELAEKAYEYADAFNEVNNIIEAYFEKNPNVNIFKGIVSALGLGEKKQEVPVL